MTDSRGSSAMKLAPGVVDTIIAITTNEVEGVVGVDSSTPSGIKGLFQRMPTTTGIETAFQDDKLDIVLHIQVYYGYVLPDLAAKLRQAIVDALQVQVGIEVNSIDIYVDGIQFKKD